ncbi:MAG: ABC transporter substrate-binding protein [Deltaproteobacteria bacterium]|nr:ABC transporter substrate-binding protein [Deltaproteobacteria bacterium]
MCLLLGIFLLFMGIHGQAEAQVLKSACKQSEAKTLDPHMATGSQDRVVVEMIFSGLLRYRPGDMSTEAIEPDLAKAVPAAKILPDGRQEWLVGLKPGVKTHPYEGKAGYELSSEDVVYSFKRAADKKYSAFSGDYTGMTFEAMDKYTVKITLQTPTSSTLFLPKIVNRGGGLIVCKKPLEEKGGDWFRTHPVGTGAFLFKSYTPMEKVALGPHKEYFRGTPKLQGFEFFFMSDQSSREMAFQKGQIDVIEGAREDVWAEKMSKIPGTVLQSIPGSETVVAHFNMSVKPLHLLKVRQAMAYALDRKDFISLYGPKVSEALYSPVPVDQGGLSGEECAKENLLYPHDLNKAKKLLAEAGYPNGFSLDVFTSESESYSRAYEVMQAQMKKIGIDLKISVVDHATFHTRIRQNLNPIVVYLGMRPDANSILTQYFHSGSVVSVGKKPMTNFSHMGLVDTNNDGTIDSIDALIENAAKERDPRKQIEIWKEAQKKVLQDAVVYPVITLGYLFANKSYVDWGYKPGKITDGLRATEKTQILKK